MSGALSSLKILDFTTLLPGPYATMLLADLGADVLRVVSTTRPDMVDFIPPLLSSNPPFSAFSAQLGRNKRVLPLDLRHPRAIAVVHRLLEFYDIIVEQFRPGVMARLQLDYERLAAIKPQLIYCSLTGYGQTGGLSKRAGHDINFLARSGVASYGSGSRPFLPGIQIADLAGGAQNVAIGILAAALHRLTSGEGQYIDVSMNDGLLALNACLAAGLLAGGEEPCHSSTFLNGGSLYDFYETKDGRHLSVAPLEAQFFDNFCDIIGKQEWKEEGFFGGESARRKQELQGIFLTKTLSEWMDLFSKQDTCVEPVLSLSEALSGEVVQERGMVIEMPLAGGGSIKQLANPLKFSRTPPCYREAGSPLDVENGKAILEEFGYSSQDIMEMEEAGLFS